MVVSFQNSEQKLTKFLKFPEIPAKNSVIPAGIFGMEHSREFPVALNPIASITHFFYFNIIMPATLC